LVDLRERVVVEEIRRRFAEEAHPARKGEKNRCVRKRQDMR
jgi:hypothetical protein